MSYELRLAFVMFTSWILPCYPENLLPKCELRIELRLDFSQYFDAFDCNTKMDRICHQTLEIVYYNYSPYVYTVKSQNNTKTEGLLSGEYKHIFIFKI